MPIASGLSSQVGFAAEVTYGTRVAPTRFLEFLDESFDLPIDRVESSALRAGQMSMRSDRWSAGKKTPGGSVNFEVANKGFGLLLKYMLGSIASSQPSAGPDPTVWEHKALEGDMVGLALTTQFGVTDVAGTTRVFEFPGSKVAGWELSQDLDAEAKLSLDVISQDATMSQTLASASYPSAQTLFDYTMCVVSIGGSPVPATAVSLKADNGLKDDRFKLGSQTRLEPVAAKPRKYELTLDMEMQGLTEWNRVLNGTNAAVTIFWTGATISNAFHYALEVTLPYVRFDGSLPQVKGPDVNRQPLKGVALNDSTASAPCQILLRTTDTTP